MHIKSLLNTGLAITRLLLVFTAMLAICVMLAFTAPTSQAWASEWPTGGIAGAKPGDILFTGGKTGTHKTIETVDSSAMGVTMYMYKFPVSDDYYSNHFYDTGSDKNSRIFHYGDDHELTHDMGIFEPLLGEDGFPVLAGNSNEDNLAGTSFKKWFDTTATTYSATKANHLFSKSIYDDTGYLYYNCMDNYAYFDQQTGNFKVYEDIGVPWWGYRVGVDGTQRMDENGKSMVDEGATHGQFFPYDDLTDFQENFKQTTNFDFSGLDTTSTQYGRTLYRATGYSMHYGMFMQANFRQPEGGKLTTNGNTEHMRFEFTGDDDMWVFIDGVLVLDIGGCHTARSGYIDFATGEVYYDGLDCPTTLKNIYSAHNRQGVTNWEGDTFANNGTHTLKMFYMERAEYGADLLLKTNLNAEPVFETSKRVENTSGENIDGALVQEGNELTYTISVHNKSDRGQSFSIQDQVPAGLTYKPTSASDNGQYNSIEHSIYWKGIYIPAGQTKEISFKVSVNENTNTTYINSANVRCDVVTAQTNEVSNYSLAPTSCTIKAHKYLDGENPERGVYSFMLESEDDPDPSRNSITATNGEESLQEPGDVLFNLSYNVADLGKTYHYRVTEAKGDNPSIAYDENTYELNVTVTEDSGNLVATITEAPGTTSAFYNERKAKIEIYKYADGNEGKQPLKGAEFVLAEGDTWEQAYQHQVAGGITDERGILEFDYNIHTHSNYWIIETNAPDGYYLATPYRLVIEDDFNAIEVSSTVQDTSQNFIPTGEALLTQADGNAVIHISIKDDAVAAMPMTGASKTQLWPIAAGILLMALGCAYIQRRKKESKRRFYNQ